MKKTTLYIDFDKVEKNIAYLKKDDSVCLIVKAQMYGIGYEYIDELINRGFNYFGVSYIEEALEIRKINKDVDILILCPIQDEEIEICRKMNFEVTITSMNQLMLAIRKIKVHLKFDTGMGRLGFNFNECNEINDIIGKDLDNVIGIYSHFSSAEDKEVSKIQIEKFKEVLCKFKHVNFKWIHIQNTLGSINYDLEFTNMKRIGIGMWGLLGSKNEYQLFGTKLQQALELKAEVLKLKNYEGNIGYGQLDYVNGLVATLKIGYHDGLFRSARGFEFQNGGKIVGNVCMCQTMVLVDSEIQSFEIFGNNESIYDICEYQNIITYEFLVAISHRIKRKKIRSKNEESN